MGGIALLARERGVQVSGSDANVYPPMSTQLREQGIGLHEGYDTDAFDPAPDCVVVGNALSRGNPAVEKVLSAGMPYTSGPQWLADHVLQGRWVLAVSGTHGKTSTASMLAWILEYAGMNPGFLIGGVPQNFGVSARLGDAPFFVVEADEYDTAFFDKRSKFVHYRPRTLVMNNLEYDHADIFPDMAAIRTQFHHLIRTVPGDGLIVSKAGDAELEAVLETGCWTFVERFTTADMAAAWRAVPQQADGSVFDVLLDGQVVGTVRWGQLGEHNMQNALGAIAAARHGGVPVEQSIAALAEYLGVRRRMEVRGTVNDVTVYDDFAHHPTAIATTLQGLRKRVGDARILVLLEPRSNTMKMGVHRDTLAASLAEADHVWLHEPDELDWSLSNTLPADDQRISVRHSVESIVKDVSSMAAAGDHVLVMSNGGFGGIHEKLLQALQQR